jgi:hypothetical protein
MAALTNTPAPGARPSFRTPQTLSILIAMLTALAAACGLFVAGFYRDSAWVVPQNRGADLVTLFVGVPALAITLYAAGRGSVRALITWVGVLGYILYTYIGAAFAFNFNNLFLAYVALVSMSVFALITILTRTDLATLKQSFDDRTPRAPVIAFMVFLSIMLTMAYLGQMMPFFTAGTLPEILVNTGGPTMFVWVLDLGFVVPLMILASIGLWRRTALGYLLTGIVLIKCATMGLSLLGMTYFSWAAGDKLDLFFTSIWIFVAVGGLSLSTWFLRHCKR